MKGLTWVGVFVAAGIAAGAVTAALMPARYRAVTGVHIEAIRSQWDESDGTFPYRLNNQLDDLLRSALFEDEMERLMRELDLYRVERDSGRSGDALLRLRASTVVSRQRERETTERWTVAFEAKDSTTAGRTSLRLASLIKEQADKTRRSLSPGDEPKVARLLEDIRALLVASEAELRGWRRRHQGSPSSALLKQYESLKRDYTELLQRGEDFPGRILFGEPPIELKADLVKTPRVFDGKIDPPFRSFAGAGAAAGLFIGLFTMPPFFWWRRHAP